jgi:hypothetical protein
MSDLICSFGVSHPGALHLHNFPTHLQHLTREDGEQFDAVRRQFPGVAPALEGVVNAFHPRKKVGLAIRPTCQPAPPGLRMRHDGRECPHRAAHR